MLIYFEFFQYLSALILDFFYIIFIICFIFLYSYKKSISYVRCSVGSSALTLFNHQMEGYAVKLKELERLFSESGQTLTNGAEMEAALKAIEKLVKNLQENSEDLTG